MELLQNRELQQSGCLWKGVEWDWYTKAKILVLALVA
jgi:hypothetical protein